MTENCSIKRPNTLKEALDFAGALSVNPSNLKDLVGSALEERARDALGLDQAPNSVGNHNTKTISQNFKTVLTNLEELRKAIVDVSDRGNYGEYNTLAFSYDEVSCVYLFADYMLRILPSLYATLCFLKFKVDLTDCGLGGGGWTQEQCNTPNNSSSLNRWLKTFGPDGLPSSRGSNATILPGGYGSTADSNSTEGSTLKSKLDKLINNPGGFDGACLQYLVLDLSIANEYSPCSTAPCLAVMRALCEHLNTKFNSKIAQYPELLSNCKAVLSNLEKLTPDSGSDQTALLMALFEGSPYKFSERLQSEAFERYMNWLATNLNPLIESLKSLKTECTNWSSTALQTAIISGPFAYGFSFGGKWKSRWDNDEVKNEIPSYVETLIPHLSKLKATLEKYFKTSAASSSTGAAVGGLLGTAAVGGAGAAFAFNVGGLTTIVRGALGILK
ncbi:secreted antigen 1 [Babesia caballi]|uniref:Secreted antigen 1 n=1 Tax=Babesia caballi TaxID=5871 RepID=A0AAV4LLH0_BABCB|nr:secreted antigen 1 [Babesia caballi]